MSGMAPLTPTGRCLSPIYETSSSSTLGGILSSENLQLQHHTCVGMIVTFVFACIFSKTHTFHLFSFAVSPLFSISWFHRPFLTYWAIFPLFISASCVCWFVWMWDWQTLTRTHIRSPKTSVLSCLLFFSFSRCEFISKSLRPSILPSCTKRGKLWYFCIWLLSCERCESPKCQLFMMHCHKAANYVVFSIVCSFVTMHFPGNPMVFKSFKYSLRTRNIFSNHKPNQIRG